MKLEHLKTLHSSNAHFSFTLPEIEVDSGSLYYSNPKSVKLQGRQLVQLGTINRSESTSSAKRAGSHPFSVFCLFSCVKIITLISANHFLSKILTKAKQKYF